MSVQESTGMTILSTRITLLYLYVSDYSVSPHRTLQTQLEPMATNLQEHLKTMATNMEGQIKPMFESFKRQMEAIIKRVSQDTSAN